jgi:class 3 adenylate cyclase
MSTDHQPRRLATILAADVFGYSRLMAENEEDTLRTLKAHRAVIDRLITRHEGRIFNSAGDSVLAEFGSAVEAVRCAITIQDELRVRNAQIDPKRRMELRIGINVGDVLVDGGNLYGDGVNIAARLESIAAPGNIYISGSVFSLVKNKLSYGFEDIGPQTVKNIPEPVPAFRLTASITSPAPVKPRNRLVVTAFGIAASLAIVGVVTWAYRASLISERQPGIQAEAQKQALGAQVAVLPSRAGKAFNGIWEFQLFGGPSCMIKTMVFRRKILDGIIMTNDGRKLGVIGNEGRFQFSNPSPMDQNIMVESQGAISGNTGEGNYTAIGTPCQGTYKIRLVERP